MELINITVVTAKVKIHSSAIKTNNLTLRIKAAHFLSRVRQACMVGTAQGMG